MASPIRRIQKNASQFMPIGVCIVLLMALLLCGCRDNSAQAAERNEPVQSEPVQVKPTPPAPVPLRKFTLVAVGDVMLDRGVWRTIKKNGTNSILAKMRDLTRSADIAFANLECPLSSDDTHGYNQGMMFDAPRSTVKVLLDGGFDVVSLANNHSLNAGKSGITSTVETLDKNAIAYCGARRPEDKADAWKPTYMKAGGYTLAFMGYTDLSFEHGSYAKVGSYDTLAEQLASAKKNCDFLLVSVHWGNEYENRPSVRQKKLAHFLVDNGADVVLGHHPHVLQGMEIYKDSPIMYSMGNFIFDQKEGERMESAVFHLTYTEDHGWNIFAKPVWIPRSRMGPITPDANRAGKISARLKQLSTELGTAAKNSNNKVWLTVPRPEPGSATVATRASNNKEQ